MQAFEGKPLFLIRFNPLKTRLKELESTFDAFRDVQITPETPMLTVAFIGYTRQYDVASEMERVAKERAEEKSYIYTWSHTCLMQKTSNKI